MDSFRGRTCKILLSLLRTYYLLPALTGATNDWPVCRRPGRSGLVVGEVEAVGSTGLLGVSTLIIGRQCIENQS